jgi:hypothetical protein
MYVGGNYVRHSEMRMVEPLVPEPSAFGVEIAIEKLKTYRSPTVDQIVAELMQLGSKTVHSEINKLNSILVKDELPLQWKKYTEAYYCYQLHTKYYQTFFFQG